MYAVLFVLDDSSRLDEILDAWYAIGIGGATIFESSGIQRRRASRLNIPVRYALPTAGEGKEGNYTLYTVVPDEAAVRACLEVVERLIGDLEMPNTGIFSAWPLAVVKGVPGSLRKGKGTSR